jgi:hypothetical protein
MGLTCAFTPSIHLLFIKKWVWALNNFQKELGFGRYTDHGKE